MGPGQATSPAYPPGNLRPGTRIPLTITNRAVCGEGCGAG